MNTEHPVSQPEPAPGAPNSADGGTGTVALDLDALHAVAEAATPGPWEISGASNDYGIGIWKQTGVAHVANLSKVSKANVKHLVAFDPPTVLALIERAERAEAEVTRLREGLAWLIEGNPQHAHNGHPANVGDDECIACWDMSVRDLLAGGEGQ